MKDERRSTQSKELTYTGATQLPRESLRVHDEACMRTADDDGEASTSRHLSSLLRFLRDPDPCPLGNADPVSAVRSKCLWILAFVCNTTMRVP